MDVKLVLAGLALILLGILLMPTTQAATAVHVESSLAGSPIYPTMQGNKSAIYPMATFYLYSTEPTNYSIKLLYSPNGTPSYINGTVEDFKAVEQVSFSSHKLIWLCSVSIGGDVYTYERVLVMHKAIGEDEIKQREEKKVVAAEDVLKGKLQSFAGGVVGALLIAGVVYLYRKKRQEEEVEPVV